MLIPKGWHPLPRTRSGSGMGITNVDATVCRSDKTGPSLPVTMMVDSGAIYSVLPASIWRPLALVGDREVDFSLADGTIITREVSECRFDIEGRGATSPVVLGRDDEGPLLGAVTLETLGLVLNPLTRQLMSIRLMLGSMTPRRTTTPPIAPIG
jgi:predicted aspartyl protease